MAFSTAQSPDGPLSEINTTPLIDVMLVLLIMLILTIPLATHSVDVDLPGDCPPTDRLKNRIAIDASDRILWNDAPINRRQFAALLRQTQTLPVEPELQFEPAAQASYAASAEVLNEVRKAGVTKFGFVGNERFAQFGRE